MAEAFPLPDANARGMQEVYVENPEGPLEGFNGENPEFDPIILIPPEDMLNSARAVAFTNPISKMGPDYVTAYNKSQVARAELIRLVNEARDVMEINDWAIHAPKPRGFGWFIRRVNDQLYEHYEFIHHNAKRVTRMDWPTISCRRRRNVSSIRPKTLYLHSGQ